MNERGFNPARLRMARQRRGLTKVALANLVGLTPRRIAALENEGEPPSAGTIQEFATRLDFPEEFFYQPDPPDFAPSDVSFRSFSRLSASRRSAALAAAAMAVEVAHWIDARFEIPEPSLPDLRDMDPPTAASVLRATWGLGNDPAPNVIHLLEAHGVRVYSLVDECADLDALSLWFDGIPFVFLTQHKSAERGRWDAAHELGHLLLHLDGPPQGREQEREADSFASEFLLPEPGVMSTAAPFPSLPDIQREKIFWRVSAVAYIRRLYQLGLVTEWQYRSLIVEASQAGYRRTEGDIDREGSQLMPKVMLMLRQEGATLSHMAADLGIALSDLRGLLMSSFSVVMGSGEDSINKPHSDSINKPHLRVV